MPTIKTGKEASASSKEVYFFGGLTYYSGQTLKICYPPWEPAGLIISGPPLRFAGTSRYSLPLGWLERDGQLACCELFYGEDKNEMGEGKTLLRLHFFSSLIHPFRKAEYYEASLQGLSLHVHGRYYPVPITLQAS